jgi:hypothetical protein
MQTKAAPTQSLQALRLLQIQEHQAKLQQARKNIKTAYQAGLFSGGMILLFTLASTRNPEIASNVVYNVLMLTDVVVIFGLTYGISRGNRLAAKSMLGYFLLGKLIQLSSNQLNPVGIALGSLLLYCFYLGVIGTTALHELQRTEYYQGEFEQVNEFARADEYDGVADSASAPKAASKFWVSDELVELCQGDRSQAEWLIHQLRVKHPSQDMDWYNERAIEQLNNLA